MEQYRRSSKKELDLGLAKMHRSNMMQGTRTRNPVRGTVRNATGRKKELSQHQRAMRQKQRRRRKRLKALVELLLLVSISLAIFLIVYLTGGEKKSQGTFGGIWKAQQAVRDDSEGQLIQGISAEAYGRHPEWTEDFLTPNEYSRPGDPLTQVKNIFVHYTANPGTSAAQNRSYFEQQKDMHEASVSSHFIIGYEGEILQIVPLDEIAYAVQTRNMDSISIECCYKAENGQFTQETYDSLIELLSWLIQTYGLDSEDILRHYDCGGKKCPLYYTEHEDAWEQLKTDVAQYTM